MDTNAQRTDKALAERCFTEQAGILFFNANTTFIVNCVLLSAVFWYFLGNVSDLQLLPWAGAFFGTLLVRLWLAHRYPRLRAPLDIHRAVGLHTLATILIGGFWGVSPFLLAYDGALSDKLMLTIIIVSVTSAGATNAASYLPAAIGFLAAALPPVGVFLVLQESSGEKITGLLAFLYTAMHIRFIYQYHRRLITAIRQTFSLEQQAKVLEASVEKAERASQSQSDFLANVSHEIRTPMAGLLGMLQFVKESPDGPESKQYLKIAYDSAQTLLALINDILDMSKIQGGKFSVKPHPCDLRAIVSEPLKLLEHVAREKNIALTANFDFTDELWLLIDGPRVRQVVLNLVGNALKFTERGSVRVDVTHNLIEGRFFEFQISVTDTGIGIEEKLLETLFDRFVQADTTQSRSYTGTGLGLSISRGLIEVMGGRLAAESQVGEGSCFTCTLAAHATDKPALPQTLAASQNVDADQSFHLLAVDDNLVNLMIVEKMVRGFGWTVEGVDSGPKAIEAFARNSGRYDAILMDIQMPKMDGIETTYLLRNMSDKGKTIPVIAVTANSFNSEIQHLFEQGMDGYVSKPIDKAQLRLEIATVIQRKNGKLPTHSPPTPTPNP